MKYTRSISVDIFLSKQHQDQYSRHLHKLEEIKQFKEDPKKTIQEVKKISKQMKKARDQARSFKIKQENNHRGYNDAKMLKNMESYENIAKFGKGIHNQHPSMSTKRLRNKSPSLNAHLNAKIDDKTSNVASLNPAGMNSTKNTSIREYIQQIETKKLIEGIKSYQVNPKIYKKKIATQISQYLKLRQHAQRYKTNQCQSSQLGHKKVAQKHRLQGNKQVLKTERSKNRMEQKSITKNTGGIRQKVRANSHNLLKTEPTQNIVTHSGDGEQYDLSHLSFKQQLSIKINKLKQIQANGQVTTSNNNNSSNHIQ